MDAKRGSARYRKLLAIEFDRPLVYARPKDVIKRYRGDNRGWFCWEPGAMVTKGFGMTKNDAKVDFVEEVECLTWHATGATPGEYDITHGARSKPRRGSGR